VRIYIGNKEIAGYFMRLKDGFDKIGVKADLLYLVGNKFYTVKTSPLLMLNQRMFVFYKKYNKSIYFPAVIPVVILMAIFRMYILASSLVKYDVFILNSEPFFNFSELAILKWFNKKIIVVFLGTESRPSYISGNYVQGKYFSNGKYNFNLCYKEVKSQAERIARIEKYADHIINHPPTALFQKKPFIAWCHIGFPNDVPTKALNVKQSQSRIVKVLHAPSNAVSKGSETIMDIIDKLRKDGLPVEFVKLENVPNEKVLDELAKCDFVVDELYSDIPIGGLGTEAAFAMKPVINGGYYADQIKDDHHHSVIPPSCFCMPENLELCIKEYILNKSKRENDAKILNTFVTENWNSTNIALKYMRIISGDIPSEWKYNPAEIKYFMGYGIEKNKLKSFLIEYIKKFGEKALFLDDKPTLKSHILEFLRVPSN